MHGLIFETSVWLLAESTRLLPFGLHGSLGSEQCPLPERIMGSVSFKNCAQIWFLEQLNFIMKLKKRDFFLPFAPPFGWGSGIKQYQGKGLLDYIRGHQKVSFPFLLSYFLAIRAPFPHKRLQISHSFLVSGFTRALSGHNHRKTDGSSRIYLLCIISSPILISKILINNQEYTPRSIQRVSNPWIT